MCVLLVQRYSKHHSFSRVCFYYNNTHILCVRVFVPLEISKTRCRITTLLTPSWIASPKKFHKLFFKPIKCMVREKKPLDSFAGYTLKAVRACYTSSYPEQGESCPLFEVRWNILEGYPLKDTLHITHTIMAIAFTRMYYRFFYMNGIQIFAM